MSRAKNGGRDAYFTAPWFIEDALSVLAPLLRPSDVLVEPAAGDGRWADAVLRLRPDTKVLCYDVVPAREDVQACDWLAREHPLEGVGEDGSIVVFGNPPFGFAGSLAVKFFDVAAHRRARLIAFVLPLSFAKESMRQKVPKHYHLGHHSEVPHRAFELDGEPYDVPCCFQVWERRPKPRAERVSSPPPKGLKFMPTKAGSNLAMRRVGGSAGRLIENGELTPSTTYFLQAENASAMSAILTNAEAHLRDRSRLTAGVRSVSKEDVVEEVARAAARKKFDPTKVDTFTAAGQMKFMDVPEGILSNIFRDGRISGLLADHMLSSRYGNLSAHPKGSNAGFDLYQTSGGKATDRTPLVWETKVWTQHGCSLLPSNMKGKGRKKDTKVFVSQSKKLTGGFIVVDIRKFPTMTVFAIPNAAHLALGHPDKITDKSLDSVLSAVSGKVVKKKAAKDFSGDPKSKDGMVLKAPGADVVRIFQKGKVFEFGLGRKKGRVAVPKVTTLDKAQSVARSLAAISASERSAKAARASLGLVH